MDNDENEEDARGDEQTEEIVVEIVMVAVMGNV